MRTSAVGHIRPLLSSGTGGALPARNHFPLAYSLTLAAGHTRQLLDSSPAGALPARECISKRLFLCVLVKRGSGRALTLPIAVIYLLSPLLYSVGRIYMAINSAERIYMRTGISLNFPRNILISVKEINPNPIPSEME